MTINLHLPARNETLRPTITVIGVGGAGGNAVNNMIAAQLQGVNFVTANTDAQALDNALAENRIQLGVGLTQGLGAGASPDVGRAAAEEAIEDIQAAIGGSHMVFITAGMGGGTGTGAAPVVARLAREQGILTVGVVTKPFQFEGTHRMKIAERGLEELQNYVDTMIVIPNQNLFRVANERTTFADAFRMADEVLHSGVRGVTDLMVMPGLINLDFADIRAVMREMGKAMMGTGEAEGERRAVEAAEAAISNPLLDDVSMKGARGVLINITGGHDMTLFEVDEAANRIRDEVDAEANIIFGSTFQDSMEGKMRVSVVATGIEARTAEGQAPRKVSHDGMPDMRNDIRNSASFHFGYTARREPEKAKQKMTAAPEAAVRVGNKTASSGLPPERRDSSSYEKEVTAVAQADYASSSHPQAEGRQAGFAFAEESRPYTVPRVELRSAAHAAGRSRAGEAEREEAAAEAAEQYREPSFAAPPPSQPSHRSFYSVKDEDRQGFRAAEALSPREQRPAREEEEESGGGSSALGFLQRMAGRAFSGGGREERQERQERSEDQPQPAAKREPAREPSRESRPPRAEVSERDGRPASAAQAEDEYLEIPAFLRRQAN